LEGGGVRVIVIGDKGKGDAELFGPNAVKNEDKWDERFAPSLVKTR